MVPASAFTEPAMMLETVDLPAPFSPSRATSSPGRMSKPISCRTLTGPKLLVMPESTSPPVSPELAALVIDGGPRSGMLLDELLDVLLRRQRGVLQLVGRQLLAGNELDGRVDRKAAHA